METLARIVLASCILIFYFDYIICMLYDLLIFIIRIFSSRISLYIYLLHFPFYSILDPLIAFLRGTNNPSPLLPLSSAIQPPPLHPLTPPP